MTPSLRRALSFVLLAFSAVAMARLIAARGLSTVGPITLRVGGTAFVAWLVHVVAHETAHALTARWQRFELRGARLGPIAVVRRYDGWHLRLGRLDFSGGVQIWPCGRERLRQRLAAVAVAGPLTTVVLSLASVAAFLASGLPITSTPGIIAAMGGLLALSSLTPGSFSPRPLPSGSDLDQLRFDRRVEAHWTHAAVLQALNEAPRARLGDVVDLATVERLLPPDPAAPEPIVAIFVVLCLEADAGARARDRVTALLEAEDDDSGWLLGDVALQDGLAAALIDGDPPRARARLAQADRFQAQPWFRLLLDAALALDEGRRDAARALLADWQRHADEPSFRPFAKPACGWAVRRLEARLAATP